MKFIKLVLGDYRRHFCMSVFLTVLLIILEFYFNIFLIESLRTDFSVASLSAFKKQLNEAGVEEITIVHSDVPMQAVVLHTEEKNSLGKELDAYFEQSRSYSLVHVTDEGHVAQEGRATYTLLFGDPKLLSQDFQSSGGDDKIRVYLPEGQAMEEVYLYPFLKSDKTIFSGHYQAGIWTLADSLSSFDTRLNKLISLPVISLSYSDASQLMPFLELSDIFANIIVGVDSAEERGQLLTFTSNINQKSDGYYNFSLIKFDELVNGNSDAQSGARLMLYIGVVSFLAIYVLVAASITWILRVNQIRYGVHWLLGASKRKLFFRFMLHMSLIYIPAILVGIATQNFVWKNTLPEQLLQVLAPVVGIIAPLLILVLVQISLFLKRLDVTSLIRSND